MSPESRYHNLRNKCRPSRIKLVFLLESPPASGKYFYNPTGDTTEPLFAAMMRVIGENASTKKRGLTAFKDKGFFLMDAMYKPVNHIRTKRVRDQAILADLPELIKDLNRALPDRRTPIILVKANICRLLKERLQAYGFNIINDVEIIPFPSHNHQPEFHQRLRELFRKGEFNL
jgi:hypothetical protein